MPEALVPARLAFQEGTPYSEAFGDVYHSAAGGPAQARHVFLRQRAAAALGRPRALRHPRDRLRLRPQLPRHLAGLAARSGALRTAALRVDREASVLPARPPDASRAVPGVEARSRRAAGALADAGAGRAPCGARRRQRGADAVLRRHQGRARPAARGRRLLPRRLRAGEEPRHVVAAADALALAPRRARRHRRDLERRRVGAPALEATGFAVEKRAGFGDKSEMLVATQHPNRDEAFRREQSEEPSVVGAGLAGAAVCERLCARGWEVDAVRAPRRAGAGSLGQPCRRRSIRSSRRTTASFARLTRAGFLFALDKMGSSRGPALGPVRRAAARARREGGSLAARSIAALGLPPEYAQYVTREEASRARRRAGRGAGGLWFPQGGWIQPR